MGLMNTRDTFLAQGQQQTITVSNMKVPVRADGERIKYTLKVRLRALERTRDIAARNGCICTLQYDV